ncbi:PRC-barrel domain-containing protein, partial [Fulvimarina sp. MAC3]|uniref:PRC-barrel domain-containing protein n=1 Tax=Fulvimarina sp. MAC3 TaxID=3148887 RepID=UPI0031FE0C93
DEIEDMDVYDGNGTEVGEVDDVLGSDPQTPTHIEVNFDDDDASTYPDRDDVVVPISNFSLLNNRLTVDLSPEEVQNLPVRND